MKILVVSANKPREEIRIKKLSHTLRSLGHTVHYFHFKTKRNKSRFKILGKTKWLLRLFRAALTLKDYDIIHMIDIWDVGFLPFLLNRTPKVFDVRTGWGRMIRQAGEGWKWRVLGWIADQITKVLVRFSDHVTITDPRTAQQILMMKPRSWSFLRNMPIHSMFQAPRKTSPGDGVTRFGYAGLIAENRGLKDLLKAWHTLHHGKAHLIIAGWFSNGAYRDRILPLLAHPHIQFIGELPYDRMPAFYNRIDVFVVPTSLDYWSLRIGEALAARVPIILCEGPLHRRIANGGAVFFQVGEEIDLTASIAEAIGDAVRDVTRLKQEASCRVVPDWEEDVARLVRVYRKIRRTNQ